MRREGEGAIHHARCSRTGGRAPGRARARACSSRSRRRRRSRRPAGVIRQHLDRGAERDQRPGRTPGTTRRPRSTPSTSTGAPAASAATANAIAIRWSPPAYARAAGRAPRLPRRDRLPPTPRVPPRSAIPRARAASRSDSFTRSSPRAEEPRVARRVRGEHREDRDLVDHQGQLVVARRGSRARRRTAPPRGRRRVPRARRGRCAPRCAPPSAPSRRGSGCAWGSARRR